MSFTLDNGLQVDVRLLDKESFGAALLYFTGSKEHNVTLRGRANDMGYTLNEYALATLKGERRVAGRTEEEIYAKLKLDYIPPELRENTGEIDAAEQHKLPKLIELADIKGDLQMHSTASDGKHSVEEMAEAARQLGHEYIAMTDHSKSVTIANGLDEKRMAAHIKKLRAIDAKGLGIRVLAGSEVDILKDGALDYSDEILAQFDVVVCSIHSYMQLDRAAMTDRMLACIENPYTQIIGHPTGRRLLARDSFDYDMEKVLDACAKHGVAMECNSYPDRLDLRGRLLAHVQGARRQGGHLDRLPQHPASALHPLRRDHGAARLAREGQRHQYPSRSTNSWPPCDPSPAPRRKKQPAAKLAPTAKLVATRRTLARVRMEPFSGT